LFPLHSPVTPPHLLSFPTRRSSDLATAVLLSPQRMTDTLETYYSAGGPFIPPTLLRAGQQGLLALALLVSAVFLANFIWMWSSEIGRAHVLTPVTSLSRMPSSA